MGSLLRAHIGNVDHYIQFGGNLYIFWLLLKQCHPGAEGKV